MLSSQSLSPILFYFFLRADQQHVRVKCLMLHRGIMQWPNLCALHGTAQLLLRTRDTKTSDALGSDTSRMWG